MDLVQTIRKEGSRGGRGEFKWSDVQTSSHRDHYLGHSVMAPTGRWAKGKDLTWYAKGDTDAAETEANKRKEEIKRVKEAESDAMARALGLPVPDRSNPNNEALGSRDLDRAIHDSTSEQPSAGGIGYGKGANAANSGPGQEGVERIEGNAEQQDKELAYALKEYKRRHRDKDTTDPGSHESTSIATVTEVQTASAVVVLDQGLETDRCAGTLPQVRNVGHAAKEADLPTDIDTLIGAMIDVTDEKSPDASQTITKTNFYCIWNAH